MFPDKNLKKRNCFNLPLGGDLKPGHYLKKGSDPGVHIIKIQVQSVRPIKVLTGKKNYKSRCCTCTLGITFRNLSARRLAV